jgi:predicted nucleotidyltransferase component of viral defense system
MVEKAFHLLNLPNVLNSHPFLKGKWALKGGTALNLFVFDLPRLSVDIDLNYIGKFNREEMLADRPKTEQAAQAVFSREGFTVKKMPGGHAGGKRRLSYQSFTGQSGNLEVDLELHVQAAALECSRRRLSFTRGIPGSVARKRGNRRDDPDCR